jgi:hypothetical protein
VAEKVIAALSGVGAAVAGMEIVRLVNASVVRLPGRGTVHARVPRRR